MTNVDLDQRIDAIRTFNRFYTQRIGALRAGLLRSPFSLTEARILYELANREHSGASELRSNLGLDASYLSRILKAFAKNGLVTRTASKADGRKRFLRLTEKGRRAFSPLNVRARDEIRAMLDGMPVADQGRLIEAMNTIENLLGAKSAPGVPYLLRHHQPGDMGWVIHRHGVLYSQEYGWDEHFEALVADIAARFVSHFDPKRERCWIAERENEIVGCVFLVKKSKLVAQLRLLLVEPKARGLGIGHRLVSECVRFAGQMGYKKVTLWTNDVLHAARHIYEQAGFQRISEERHHSFGHDLVGQMWELTL